MNFIEAMNVVHNRIQQLEPENAKKIIGYLLYTEDNSNYDMIRLAFCPDSAFRSVVERIKHTLANHIPPPVISSMRTGFLENPTDQIDSLQNNSQFLNFQDSSSGFFSREQHQIFPPRTSRRSPSLPEFPVKICHYFSKGFCKHGNNCRYFHAPERDSFGLMFNPNNEEHVVSPVSLEKLEREIIELLKSRRGAPISIASLPMMYNEKYGRTLQAEGYLTESQRHGKAGYSLTKLLARLNNTIRLIDRPHGQHAVILAEDVSKFTECPGTILAAGSRQIYLTFPADSSFSEQDVSNYFSKFGHVEDVRIPCQQERMFGFVTFAYAETVKIILAKGNPHYICGARVLVKPYREKTRPKPVHGMRYGSQYNDRDIDMNTLQLRGSESSRLMRKQFLEQSVSKSLLTNYSYHAGQEQLSYLLDYLRTEDSVMNITTNYRDNDRRINAESLDSQVLNLPDSPFSSLYGTGISMST